MKKRARKHALVERSEATRMGIALARRLIENAKGMTLEELQKDQSREWRQRIYNAVCPENAVSGLDSFDPRFLRELRKD